jgi:hypothetical protein
LPLHDEQYVKSCSAADVSVMRKYKNLMHLLAEQMYQCCLERLQRCTMTHAAVQQPRFDCQGFALQPSSCITKQGWLQIWDGLQFAQRFGMLFSTWLPEGRAGRVAN